MVYVMVLYFICSSLISVGFGNVLVNINFEKIFFVCVMFIGGKFWVNFFMKYILILNMFFFFF